MSYQYLVVFSLLCISLCTGAPVSLQDYGRAVITKFESSFVPFVGYRFSYDTSDGQSRSEEADIRPINEEESSLTVRGSYNYVADDGENVIVNYTADENGFHPEGNRVVESAGVRKLGIPSAAIASLAGGGLG